MFYPVPGGRITGRFDDPARSGRQGPHAAIDIAAKSGTPMFAVEPGVAFAWVAHRPENGPHYWPSTPDVHERPMPFANYFYDMYGGCVFLRGESGWTHVYAHIYGRQLYRLYTGWRWIEESRKARYPITATYSDTRHVGEGDLIGYVGDAGFSTGPHLHLETHRGWAWDIHEQRINLEEYIT